MRILSLCLSLLIAAGARAATWDPYKEIASPEAWDALKPGMSLMFSGNDAGGQNKDHGNFLRIEPEGATFLNGIWVLAEMEGPGAITRIWVTGRSIKGDAARINGRISIYIDAKDKPAIDLPTNDFFGKTQPFVPPLAMPTSGGWVNYVPIPFSKYCKVTVTDGENRYAHRHSSKGDEIPQLYYHVNWRKAPAGAKVEPFSMSLSKNRLKLLKQAADKMQWAPSVAGAKPVTIAPGQTVEVFKAEGKGRIAELSMVAESLEGLDLTVYWDGSDKPAIDAPARLFFLEGLTPRPFKSLPFVFDGKTHTCRFPMPYAKGARICLKNATEKDFTLAVAVKTGKAGKADLRFRARNIDEHLAKGSPDLVILDSQNGPGHFVGMALTLPNNFLEGNESISVDGGKPMWLGTGTEDYFNGGWYFCRGPYDQPFSGCIHQGAHVTAYRFHLADSAPYTKSIKMTLEHGAANDASGRARGVVYWYEK